MGDVHSSTAPWRSWSLADWNRALFEHVFGSHDGSAAPVTRLVITSDLLRQIVRDSSAPSNQIQDAFRDVMREQLRSSNRSLCNDADRQSHRWNRTKQIPPFFAHLVLTCLAASQTSKDDPAEGNFRARLNELLDRPAGPSYGLSSLPKLWEALQRWLTAARERGEAYRELILPPRRHRIIGYSMGLAFPINRDRRLLIDLLTGQDFVCPPPVVPVLQALEQGLDRFSEPFQDEFHRLRQAFRQRDPELYRHSVWASVCDILNEFAIRSGTVLLSPARALLRLDRDHAWRFVLTLYLDRSQIRPLPRGLRVEPAYDFAVGDFAYLLRADPEHASGETVAGLLLGEKLGSMLPGLSAPSLFRAVHEGILLFLENEQGVWEASFSRPGAGEVRALVREDLKDRFLELLLAAGAHPGSHRTLEARWSEVSGFSAAHLLEAGSGRTDLSWIRCLQEAPVAPQVYLRGGVPISEGWLGRQEGLPTVVAPGANRVTMQAVVGAEVTGQSPVLELQPDPRQFACWRFQDPAGTTADLDGGFLIQSRARSHLLANRQVDFRIDTLGHSFAWPKQAERWLCEGGQIDVSEPGEAGLTPAEVTGCTEPSPFLLAHLAGAETSSVPAPVPSGMEALVEIVAGLALRRSWVAESDLLEWIHETLGVDRRLYWDILRAWVEAGCLECFSYRLWRLRCYFARRPRLILYRPRAASGLIGIIQGLLTVSVRRQLELVSTEHPIELDYRMGFSPWAPPVMSVRADSWEHAIEFSHRSQLDPPRWLLPLDRCVSAVDAIAASETSLQRNHTLAGYWDWDRCRFGPREPGDSSNGLVEWYRRDDIPDAYGVRRRDGTTWYTRSRTWALLAGSSYRGEPPFEPGSRHTLVRSHPNRLHLPLPVGRWATVVSGMAPGPVSIDGAHDYSYAFGTRLARDQALQSLWPSRAPDLLQMRARWLAALIQSRPYQPGRPSVAVPAHVTAVLSSHLASEQGRIFARTRFVAPQLLPHLISLASQLQRSLAAPGNRKL